MTPTDSFRALYAPASKHKPFNSVLFFLPCLSLTSTPPTTRWSAAVVAAAAQMSAGCARARTQRNEMRLFPVRMLCCCCCCCSSLLVGLHCARRSSRVMRAASACARSSEQLYCASAMRTHQQHTRSPAVKLFFASFAARARTEKPRGCENMQFHALDEHFAVHIWPNGVSCTRTPLQHFSMFAARTRAAKTNLRKRDTSNERFSTHTLTQIVENIAHYLRAIIYSNPPQSAQSASIRLVYVRRYLRPRNVTAVWMRVMRAMPECWRSFLFHAAVTAHWRALHSAH